MASVTIYSVTRQHSDETVPPLQSCVRQGVHVSVVCGTAKRPVRRAIQDVQIGDVIRIEELIDSYYPVTDISSVTVEE